MQLAKNLKGEKVHISEADRETNYFCLICDSPVVVKKGEKKEHHYAHLQSTGEDCELKFKGLYENHSSLDLDAEIVENNVVSRYSIPLLDALKGSTLTVNTIDGPKDVNVPPKSKNNDQVIIPKLGVNYAGDHVINLTVDYPEDVSQIIKILESNAI